MANALRFAGVLCLIATLLIVETECEVFFEHTGTYRRVILCQTGSRSADHISCSSFESRRTLNAFE